ncbi:hypothetical protein H0266_16105 [Halobacillus locisalis]|uniref:Uncharacterized protein n=1 Tax=Halobacillus locisalis TaxID=220753 RepID=A0A838CWA4_9BACI|nr:hypothetical protein [Halobacillus locisalis]MBA2176422.1 hypothetical protein [Halobacillus locisalis]
MSENHKKKKKEDFEEKFEKEKLIDGIPDTEVRKEKKEEKDGPHSKNDSVTEEEYDEDLRP